MLKKKLFWLGNISLALLVIIGGLVLIEIFLRYYINFFPSFWFAGGSHPPGLVSDHETLGYTLTPNFSGFDIQKNGDFKTEVVIDNEGRRTTENSNNTNESNTILALGDSMTYGEGVLQDKTYSALVEDNLNNNFSKWKVINAGVPGYSILQMKLSLEDFLRHKTPQVVLVGFLPAEIGRLNNPFVYYHGFIVASNYLDKLNYYKGSVIYSSWRRPPIRNIDIWLQKHSFIFRLLSPRIYNLTVKINNILNKFDITKLSINLIEESNANLADKSIKIIQAMKKMLPDNVPFIVLLIPSSNKDISWAKDSLQDNDIEFIDLTSLNDSNYRFINDGHWNEYGHASAATLVTDFLTNQIELK